MPTVDLRVALDVTPLLGFRTGIGRSVAESHRALVAIGGPTITPFALGLRTRRVAGDALPTATRVIGLPTRVLLNLWGRFDHPSVDRWLGPVDVVHGTNYVVGPSRHPTVVSVYDTAFVRHPEECAPWVPKFDAVLRRALDRGAFVHTASRAMAEDIDDIYGPGLLADERITTIPLGIPELGPEGGMPPALERWLARAPYVLALGTLERRKGLPTLVDAFAHLATDRPSLRLVLAGRDGNDRSAVDAAVAALPHGLRARVLIPGPVDDLHRRALLTGAAVLAYPSKDEGFGFPVLEAMSVGVPVVASRVGAIPEVAHDAALLVPSQDVDALADGLARVLDDRDLADVLVRAGTKRTTRYSWDATARGLVALYERIARSR